MSQNGLRVIGGATVNPNSHPWQAYLTDARGGMTCGGSLINNQWVLTGKYFLFKIIDVLKNHLIT